MNAAIALRRKQVIELSHCGTPTSEIAAMLGVNRRTVQRDRKAFDTQPRVSPTRGTWTAAEQQRAEQLIAEGATLTEVADTLGRPHSTVYHRFPRQGWTQDQELQRQRVANVTAAREARRQRVMEMSRTATPVADIAAALGVNERTVQRDREACKVERSHLPWTQAEQERAQQLIADGASLSEVADTLGRPRSTVFHRFPGQGWTAAQACQFRHVRKLERQIGLI